MHQRNRIIFTVLIFTEIISVALIIHSKINTMILRFMKIRSAKIKYIYIYVVIFPRIKSNGGQTIKVKDNKTDIVDKSFMQYEQQNVEQKMLQNLLTKVTELIFKRLTSFSLLLYLLLTESLKQSNFTRNNWHIVAYFGKIWT